MGFFSDLLFGDSTSTPEENRKKASAWEKDYGDTLDAYYQAACDGDKEAQDIVSGELGESWESLE